MTGNVPHGGITRRRLLLAGGAGALAALPLARLATGWSSEDGELFLTASDDLDGRHFVSATDARGVKRFSLEVEARCHGVAVAPVRRDRAVVFARRPGTVAYDVDLRAGAIRRTVRSAEGRHLFGHGVFSPDGSVLYTTENDVPHGEGIVAVRDADDLRVLAEVRTRGIGPHELRVLEDGRTLVVANGGIATEISSARGRRRDLNVPEMDPSLVYLDARDGRLLAQRRPDDRFASVRHLALGPDGVVGVAMQYAGPETNPFPVVGFQRGDGPIRHAPAPHETRVRMQRYVASIAIAPGGVAAATCPRGDLVTFWDSERAAYLGELRLKDAGGVATSADGTRFVVTTGFGEVAVIDATTLATVREPRRAAATRWDNHLAGVYGI